MNWSMIDLCAVREVAELRLPDHERVRRGDRVAVLEAQAGVLGERRVVASRSGPWRRARAASARTSRPFARRAAPRGGARTCRARSPGRSAGSARRRAAARRRPAPRRGPSRCRPRGSRLRRRSSWVASFGCTVKPSGTASSCSFRSRTARRSRGVAASTCVARLLRQASRACSLGAGAHRGVGRRRCWPRDARCGSRRRRPRSRRRSSTRRRAYRSATGGCSAMRSYMLRLRVARARRPRCGPSGGSRRGRSRRRARSARGTPSPGASRVRHASMSSALTWMIGMSKPFARSDE